MIPSTLLGRGCIPLCDEIKAEQFHQFFNEKVARVRAAMADMPSPTIKSLMSAATLLQFQAVTIYEVTAAVRILPDECCILGAAEGGCQPHHHHHHHGEDGSRP